MNELKEKIEKNREHIDINITDLFNLFFKNKLLIISITSFFAISSVLIALYLPNIYKSSATLYVANNSKDAGALSSLASQYGGIASLAGVSLPSSGSSNKGQLAIETIQSREFLKRLLANKNILPSIMAPKEFDRTSQKLVFNEKIYNEKNDEWVRKVKKNQKIIPSHIETLEFYLDSLQIKQDKVTGYITLSYEHISPYFSYNFLKLIISEVNILTRERDLLESSNALEYLNNAYKESASKEVKSAISKIIEDQLKTQMTANISSEYLLRVLDPPYLPEKKSSPARSIICIIITFFGGLISLFVVIIKDTFFKNKA